MTIDLNGSIVLVALLVPAVLVVVLARAPRWYGRSLGKHALWRLRDDVLADVRAGVLPGEHKAVSELVARVEWAIDESRSFDLLHLLIWTRSHRLVPEDTMQRLRKSVSLAGLTGPQTERLCEHRMRYNSVTIKSIMVSSWVGIAMIVRFGIPILIRTVTHRTEPEAFHDVLREATDDVAERTTLGRQARDFVTVKGPIGDPVLA